MASTSPTQLARVSTVRSRFGLHPDVPLVEDHQHLEHHDLLWSKIRLTMREPFAEFFGTFIMVSEVTHQRLDIYASLTSNRFFSETEA